jgi:uncharacterized protein (UPF0332 family)
MATWEDIALDSFLASKGLLEAGRWRSCASRAYYAAYSAVTGSLATSGVSIGSGGKPNPSHEQLPRLALHNLDGARHGPDARRTISKRLRTLRMARQRADYGPEELIDRALARDCVRQAAAIFRDLEGE